MRYAWVIIAVAALVSAISSAMRIAFGIFIDPMEELFGWSRTAASTAYAINFIVFGASSMILGRLSDRWGARPLMIGGSLLFALSMLLTAQVTALWQIYFAYGLLMGITGAIFFTPVQVMVTRWFNHRIGAAVGFVVACQALGPMILAPLLRHLVDVLSWNQAFSFTGLLGGGMMLAASLLARDYPDYGGHHADVKVQHPTISAISAEYRVARRQRVFWLLPACHLLGCVSHALPLVHVVSMATAKGISGVVAAAALSTVSGMAVLGRFNMAILAERIGGRKALVFTLTIQCLGILILYPFLYLAPSLFVLYLFAVVFGIGYGGEMVIFPIINREYFHRHVIGSVYGVQMFGAGIGMAAGGWLGGALYDLSGGYDLALLAALATGLAGIVSIWMVRPPAEERARAAVGPVAV